MRHIAVFVSLLFCCAIPTAAQTPQTQMKVAVGAELVTIEADRVALGSLLEALDAEAGTTSNVPDQFASRMVSVWVNAAPLNQAIRKIFEGSLLDYAVVEGRRIVVLGDSSGATGAAATRPVQTTPTQPQPGIGTFQLPGGARNPQAGEEDPEENPAAPAGRGGARGGRGGRGGGGGRGGRGGGQPQAQQLPGIGGPGLVFGLQQATPGLLNLPTASPSPAGQGLGPAATPFGIPLSPTDPGPPAAGTGNAAPGAPQQPFQSILGNASPTILDLTRPEDATPGLPATPLPGMPTQPLPPAEPTSLPPPSSGPQTLPTGNP